MNMKQWHQKTYGKDWKQKYKEYKEQFARDRKRWSKDKEFVVRRNEK